MARITWDSPGSRVFELGVDRGVLYPSFSTTGVAWNGLTNVTHEPTNGDIKEYYLDGRKFYQEPSNQEFGLTIEAFTYPDEFAECEGTIFGENGLGFDLQPPQPFGLSYRTRVGDDLDLNALGYKIHLIYNALTTNSGESYDTIGADMNPVSFSWTASTLSPYGSPVGSGYKPTSHIFIDSKKTNPLILKDVENILYGTESTAPRLPTPAQLIAEFGKGLFTIVENSTSGLSAIQNGAPSDLKGNISEGVYESTSTTRLSETNIPGVYDME